MITERQQEAFRMALGLLLLDDTTDIYLLDHPLDNDVKIQSHMKTAKEMEMKLYSNHQANSDFEILTNEEIACRLSEYDTVLNY